ncbi:MAG: CRISPR-associated CARF protein Csa3 [Candidatus Micrarchaeota archaeon]
MGGTTLIATFYSYKPFFAGAHAFSPKNIILVSPANLPSKEENDVKKAFEEVKKNFGEVAKIRMVRLDEKNILKVASETAKLLEQNSGAIVNISGAWKLLAQGVLYGCYARPDYVKKIVCNIIDMKDFVELPKLSYGLSTAKKELLERISKRNGKSIAQIADELDKTPGMLYQHLKELKSLGFVDEEFKITMAGRLGLL